MVGEDEMADVQTELLGWGESATTGGAPAIGEYLDRTPLQCYICTDRSNGLHYGIYTCVGFYTCDGEG